MRSNYDSADYGRFIILFFSYCPKRLQRPDSER